MGLNYRNITTTSTVPVGVTGIGTVTVDTGDDTVLVVNTSTAWVSAGAYAVDVLAVYLGLIYKNLTGVNTATTPDKDKVNWVLFEDQFKKNKENIYIYIPSTEELAEIKDVNSSFDENTQTFYQYLNMEASFTFVGAVAFEVVEGNLIEFSINNNGGADAEIQGGVLANGSIETERVGWDDKKLRQRKLPVVSVSGAGTNLETVEKT